MNPEDIDINPAEFDTVDEFKEEMQKQAYKAFIAFGDAATHNEDGTVTIDPSVQADLVIGVVKVRHELGMALNALAALKFIVRNEFGEDMPPGVAMALLLADSIIEDPEDVQMYGVPIDEDIPPEEMN